jgi:hypothetical protein
MEINLKLRDRTIYDKNGIDNDCNKNNNDNSDFNDNYGGNNDRDNHSHRNRTLTIGCTELWLVCLKTLVNLTHNCPAASDILLTHKNYNLSTGAIISKNPNPNLTFKKHPIPKTNLTNASISSNPKTNFSPNLNPNLKTNANVNVNASTNSNSSTSINLTPNLMCGNLMEICCSALSIFISWRNEAEFVEKKKEDGSNETGGTYIHIYIHIFFLNMYENV